MCFCIHIPFCSLFSVINLYKTAFHIFKINMIPRYCVFKIDGIMRDQCIWPWNASNIFYVTSPDIFNITSVWIDGNNDYHGIANAQIKDLCINSYRKIAEYNYSYHYYVKPTIHPTIYPTFDPTFNPSIFKFETTVFESDNNVSGVESIFGATNELIIGILVLGILCICGAFVIGFYCSKKLIKNHDTQQHQETQSYPTSAITSKSLGENQDEYQPITMKDDTPDHEDSSYTKFIERLSDTKKEQLYHMYLKSKLKCFEECNQTLGLSDTFIKELFATFEEMKHA